jgi:hypothetical protein
MTAFDESIEASQVEWRKTNVATREEGTFRGTPYPWILPMSLWEEGLWPHIRGPLRAYLADHKVEKHKGVNNLKSSWVLCANLYFPFRDAAGRSLLAGFLRATVSEAIREVSDVQLEYAEDPPLDPQTLLGEPSTGVRGANQTSPDVAFLVKTEQGEGLVLTENKFTEHHFYACSGRKKSVNNPDAGRCLEWSTLQRDIPGRCWQMQWGTGARPNRSYWPHIKLSERGKGALRRCPAATDGYQLFRQQALAEAIAKAGKYKFVVSAVAYDARNKDLMHSLERTGIPNVATDWASFFDGRARFVTWTHQAWVGWVRAYQQDSVWHDWLSYVENRYGYRG